ncbi:hypothetical protein GXM_01205 [Nostoc sphaeroides CCNUC1]|uniref:Uncharacterized protein n=1 Tax=Nostoc sphaeroides CCNUC1 TaxID=2653204 RepID=A0A5P8VTM4_9NOSO|nr:hypothetical protein GXM_01205 [Nostoc sphaeroides CCNUC1]
MIADDNFGKILTLSFTLLNYSLHKLCVKTVLTLAKQENKRQKFF